MRRTELLYAIGHVLNALETSGLLVFIEGHGEGKGKGKGPDATDQVLHALNQFSILATTFGPAEKALLDIFELNRFLKTKFWIEFIRMQDDMVLDFTRNIQFLRDRLPKVAELLSQDSDRFRRQIEHAKRTDVALLTVIVLEPDEQHRSRPERLVTALESVTAMYEVSATLLNASADDLTVVSCDSGSDKSFDFLGAAKTVGAVKELILAIWDRVVFFREKRVSTRLELIAESLPILERITTLVRDGSMSPEQAEILRRKVVDGATGFISSGLIIPEIERAAGVVPRQLLAPEAKMLTARTDDAAAELDQPARRPRKPRLKPV